jgi:hypothetical protein
MSDTKDDKQKDRETEYVTRLLHADAEICGLLHIKLQHIKHLMKSLRSDDEKNEKNNH